MGVMVHTVLVILNFVFPLLMFQHYQDPLRQIIAVPFIFIVAAVIFFIGLAASGCFLRVSQKNKSVLPSAYVCLGRVPCFLTNGALISVLLVLFVLRATS